jgi:CYTH domain-containing protein
MNKTVLHRLFLIDKLPGPLTAASSHLQIFDNYIDGTRLRVRKIRDPYEDRWTYILQQRHVVSDGTETRSVEMYLDDREVSILNTYMGREIRKNRYFHEFDLTSFAFDVYLGALKGLATAKVEFDTQEAFDVFQRPEFALAEITNDPFFSGENLVDKDFGDVEREISKVKS